MKKILCVLLATLLILGLCACGSDNKGNDVKPTETIDVQANKYQQALTLFNETEYYDAKKLFDELGNYKESSKYSKHCDFLVYYKTCYQSVVRDLKGQLKDPNSLQVHNVEATVVLKGSSVLLDFELDYSAANSFGGMVRNEYTAVRNVWSFSDRNEGEEFVQGLQSCINMYKHHYKMYD